ncbi:unnamed protein product, partial [Pylaiella littoralis]
GEGSIASTDDGEKPDAGSNGNHNNSPLPIDEEQHQQHQQQQEHQHQHQQEEQQQQQWFPAPGVVDAAAGETGASALRRRSSGGSQVLVAAMPPVEVGGVGTGEARNAEVPVALGDGRPGGRYNGSGGSYGRRGHTHGGGG